MKRSIQGLFYFLSIVLFFASCNKKEWDEYYGRPDDLAPPIYQQLQERGNFTNLLTLIDKSGYKNILGQSGSWTYFAANDAAFEKFFKENGFSGISDPKLDTLARKIATYGLVYNPYRKAQLSSFQTAQGLIPNASFRRKTAYYDFVYTENGKKVVDNSRNGSTFLATENNNKYIPYFIDSYLSANGLTSVDYTGFFPGNTFSGFDVADAKVLNADIPAENGIIHEIDKVVMPLQNIAQYIASNPNYSEFKKLLDKQALYISNPDLTRRYNVLTGSTDSVYLKVYSTGITFSPNNENYLTSSTDGQTYCWSIAVPTNQQLIDYNAELLQYYGTFEAAPASILLNLINSHMWRVPLWPSRITEEPNSLQEPATFAQSDVIERKVLSNGNLYGIKKVQEANVFRTIYSKPYLNPNYSLMTRAIDASDLRVSILTPTFKYTMFLLTNADMAAAGYEFNQDRNAWGYTAPGVSTVYDEVATTRVNRLVQTAVVSTPGGEFDNLAGEGVAESYNGEYIKFKNNKVYASGNVAEGSFVTVNETKTAVNGRVYYTSGILKFAENAVTPGSTLEQLAKSTDLAISQNFSHFYNYLAGSSLWTDLGKTILGVDQGAFYTLLIPTNSAIEEAVKAGLLPGKAGSNVTGIPEFSSGAQTQAQKNAVERFIQYSIINKSTVAVDGKKADRYATLLKNSIGDSRLITIRYPAENPVPSSMEIVDDSGTVSTVNYSSSNNLSNRALIHSINKVLKF